MTRDTDPALESLRLRRAALGVRIAAGRLALATDLDRIRDRLRLALALGDHALGAARYLHAHPTVAALAGGAVLGWAKRWRRSRLARLGRWLLRQAIR